MRILLYNFMSLFPVLNEFSAAVFLEIDKNGQRFSFVKKNRLYLCAEKIEKDNDKTKNYRTYDVLLLCHAHIGTVK